MLLFKCHSIDITPEHPSRLMGMNDSGQSIGIHDSLEANIMMFQDRDSSCIILNIDTLFITSELKAHLLEIADKTFQGINNDNLIVFASHTHYAPSLEAQRVKLGRKDLQYFIFLLEKLDTLFKNLASRPFAKVYFEFCENRSIGLTCNRRRRVRTIKNYFKPFIALEPNEQAKTEEVFTIASIYEEDSNGLLGVLWSFPCHPVNFPEKGLVTSEFPGAIRSHIRAKYNSEEVSVVYLPGFAGDVRAAPPERASLHKRIRKSLQLSYPVHMYRFANLNEYDHWLAGLLMAFDHSMNLGIRVHDYDTSIITTTITEDLQVLGVESKEVDSLIFRKIRIGNCFSIYSISAEPVSGYYNLYKTHSREKRFICTGYADEVFGYLPMAKQLDEGGYETEGFFDSFLVQGKFTESITSFVSSKLKQLDAIR